MNVIETGVAYGWSSLALLLSLAKRNNALLVSTVMPSPHANNEEYVGCAIPIELRSHWRIIDLAGREALQKALEHLPTIEMCHYDSDKSHEGRMWGYPRLWQALRFGGYFIFDDVEDTLAFRNFCLEIKVDPIIVLTPTKSGVKYVGILVKNNFDQPMLSLNSFSVSVLYLCQSRLRHE